MRKNERGAGFCALVYSLVLLLVLVSGLAGTLGGDTDRWTFFYYFTNQSNIIVLGWLALYGATRFYGRESRVGRFVTERTVITAVTVYISITFFIVAFVLDPVLKGKFNPVNGNGFFTHTLTPVVMWLYFFFTPGHGTVKYRRALYILIYPFVYTMLNLIVGATMTWGDPPKSAYAYGFIDPNAYPNAFVYILVLLMLIAIFGAFGVLLIRFKKYLVKNETENRGADIKPKTGSKV